MGTIEEMFHELESLYAIAHQIEDERLKKRLCEAIEEYIKGYVLLEG